MYENNYGMLSEITSDDRGIHQTTANEEKQQSSLMVQNEWAEIKVASSNEQTAKHKTLETDQSSNTKPEPQPEQSVQSAKPNTIGIGELFRNGKGSQREQPVHSVESETLGTAQSSNTKPESQLEQSVQSAKPTIGIGELFRNGKGSQREQLVHSAESETLETAQSPNMKLPAFGMPEENKLNIGSFSGDIPRQIEVPKEIDMKNTINNGEQVKPCFHEQAPVKRRKSKKEEEESIRSKLIDHIINMRIVKKYNEKAYYKDGLAYCEVDKNPAGKCIDYFNRLIKNMGVNFSTKKIIDLIDNIIMNSEYYDGEINDCEYTVFKNVCVNNCTGECITHDEYYYRYGRLRTNYVDANYILPAWGVRYQHDAFDRFMFTASGGNQVWMERAMQILGYAISSDYKAKKIFFFYGEGNNGKSVLLSFIGDSIKGQNAVTHMNMKTLLKNDFGVGELETAQLNISPDEGNKKLNAEQIGILKQLSGGDDVSGRVRYTKNNAFKSKCKLFFGSNHELSDCYQEKDPAFINRICNLPFEVSIPVEEQDVNLRAKLREEADYIISDAFNHYLMMRANSGPGNGYSFIGDDVYAPNEKVIFLKDLRYKAVNDFIIDCCDFSDPSAKTKTETLYNAFNIYDKNLNVLDKRAFSQIFNKICGDKVESKKLRFGSDTPWGYVGVKLIHS